MGTSGSEGKSNIDFRALQKIKRYSKGYSRGMPGSEGENVTDFRDFQRMILGQHSPKWNNDIVQILTLN